MAAAALGVTTLAAALGAVTRVTMRVHAATDPGQPAYYTESVLPIFQANCARCHAGLNHRGGLNIATRDSLLKGGHHGPAVVPGHPEQSLLVKLIRHEGPVDDPMNMPPAPKSKIPDADIAIVESWIRAGAAMPPADASPGR